MSVSLQVKKGMYYAVFRLTDPNGVSKQKWINTKVPADGRHKREATKVANEIYIKYSEAKVVAHKKMLFSDWIEEWLKQKTLQVDPVTTESYRSHADLHIIPYFKALGVYLEDLTPVHIQGYYNAKAKPIGDKKGQSGKSLRNHHVVIRGALEDAVRKNLIPYNPADRVELPKKERYVGSFYTSEQVNAMLEAMKATNIYGIVMMTVFYGLRRSEALGLKWEAIDFENKTFEIKNTVVKFKETHEKTTTKNTSSNRTYPLLPGFDKLLKSIKVEQAKNKLLLGEEYQNSDYVFTWPDGRRFAPDYVTRKFSKTLEKNNLPHIRYHDLRHTTASILLGAGYQLKDIQEWLGHSDIGTTANIYGHLDFEHKKKIAAGMDDLIAVKGVC